MSDEMRLDDGQGREPGDFDPEIDVLPLPKNATFKDLFDVLKANGLDAEVFLEEVRDVFPEDGDHVEQLMNDTADAAKTLLADVFPDDEVLDAIPYSLVFVDREEFEKGVRHKIVVPEPMKPREDAERDLGVERLLQIFSDVDLTQELPAHALWEQAKTQSMYLGPVIKKARETGVPDQYIRRSMLEYVQTLLIEKKSREGQLLNFRIVSNMLKNFGFGTPEDVAFFEALASGK